MCMYVVESRVLRAFLFFPSYESTYIYHAIAFDGLRVTLERCGCIIGLDDFFHRHLVGGFAVGTGKSSGMRRLRI